MTYDEFVELVARMRAAQCAYFTTREDKPLRESKLLERRVDKAIADHQDKQAKLFPF